MTIEFPHSDTAGENSPERLAHQFTLFSSEKFPTLFQRVRHSFPETTSRACILYLSERGPDELSKQMLPWLCANDYHLSALLDPKLLSLELAKRVSGYLRKTDPNFFSHLSRFAFDEQGQNLPSVKTRAMAILDELSQDDPIIPWLRQLTEHTDERVRSKAVKVLCRLRPSKSTVELHLQSMDARVRANAIEALWHVSDSNAIATFETALNDPHHRVVINALIGLHYRKVSRAFEMMLQLTEHSAAMFRAAAIWGLGTIGDRCAIPALQRLLNDPSESVREKAQRVLSSFGPEPEGTTQRKAENYPSTEALPHKQPVAYPQVA